MKIVGDAEDSFYHVDNLCSHTTRYIRNLASHERFLKDGKWWVHETHLPDLFKKAKTTGYHEVLSYDSASVHVREKIREALGKKRVVSPSFKKTTGAHALLHIAEDAPTWIIEAAWKAFVKHKHPDVGGDSDHFVKVKFAYESLKESHDESVRRHSRP